MASKELSTGLAIAGLGGFQLISMWQGTAPTLADLRGTVRDDDTLRQQLLDADYLVAGTAVTLGIAVGWITKDWTTLVLLLVIYGLQSVWYHAVLNAHQR